jgi:hypothetical protein
MRNYGNAVRAARGASLACKSYIFGRKMAIARKTVPAILRFLLTDRRIGLLFLAFIPTLLTAVQPLTIDDVFYYDYASAFRHAPLDPYGDGRMGLMVPPVLPYWGAATMAVVGNSVPLVKLALYPFAALLTFGIAALARRFAAGCEPLVLTLTVFSPWVLPAFNYMLDVPAYGIGVAALTMFISGCDRRRLSLVALAGLAAGLAMETKYNLVTIPAAMAVYGFIFRRHRDGLIACMIAASFFIGCEALMLAKYGQSHFLHNLHDGGRGSWTKLVTIPYGVIGYGALGGTLIPLGALALGASTRSVTLILGVCAVALIVTGTGGDDWIPLYLGLSASALPPEPHLSVLFGVGLVVILGLVVRRLWTDADDDKAATAFLIAWLVIETVCCIVISPWPAARRYMGILLVATLIVCRLAARRLQREPGERALAMPIAALAVVSGLGCWAIGYVDATNIEDLSKVAAAKAKAEAGADHQAWTWADFGAEYYTREAGLAPVALNSSTLAPGDVFVLMVLGIPWKWDLAGLELIGSVSAGTNLGTTITPIYFAGRRPVRGAPDTRPIAILYRATQTTHVGLISVR